MSKSQQLYTKAKTLIPGGSQLFSKRPELFLPDYWPVYYKKAFGCTVWDLDNKKYLDMGYMGMGACLLGYANRIVDNRVIQAIRRGNLTTLNVPEEVELAELLIKLHPWAQQVRYARTGGEAMAVAVRIARAATGREKILFCGYHGWHDWYLAANLADDKALDGHLLPGLDCVGVPRSLIHSIVPFSYNNIDEFVEKFNLLKGQLAAVVMEPIRNFFPEPKFLETIRQLTEKNKTVLVFDEITSGFRLAIGGAHLTLGVIPDIAVFAKAISNGFPMAAIIGTSHVMSNAQKSFISSTYWTDKIGPTAALATIKAIEHYAIIPYINAIGRQVQEGWRRIAQKHSLAVTVNGIFPLGHFTFDYPNGLAIKTLMVQLMLTKGYLVTTAFYASFAHKQIQIEKYLNALDDTFKILSQAIKSQSVEKKLKGPIVHSGFRRLL